MKSILTKLTENAGKSLAYRHTNEIDELDEGMSINDFNKLLNKCKRSGVRLNNMSASQFLYTMYKTMDPNEFKMLGINVEKAKETLKKSPVSCGGSYGWDDDDSGYSCGRSSRRSRGGYSCGYERSGC